MNNTERFYQHLKSFSKFDEFISKVNYHPVPNDWIVAIADVENSTGEIESGRYREVNAIGAATIAAVINAVKPVIIPFVFGGDGAAFCFPSAKLEKVQSALAASRLLAETDFKMALRIGTVPVSIIRKKGADVLVAKYKPLPYYQQAMFSGNGISLADELVKGDKQFRLNDDKIEPVGNFEGFECRWDEIPSPSDETISLLIRAISVDEETESLYNSINNKLVEIYGKDYDHHPIRKENLSITFSLKKLCSEATIRTRIGSNLRQFFYLLKLLILNLTGKWFMYRNKKTKNTDWGKYKERLITNTDYRKFDDSLRMVISGSEKQRKELTEFLSHLYKDRKIVYGIHSAPTSLVTCLVENYETEHIHFLDGSNGGYAFAARQLKEQLVNINESKRG